MKNFTPALVNASKPKFNLKSLFFGNASAKNYYYSARHKSEDMFLLWIESDRFGKIHCFPCVLEEQGDPMIYFSGRRNAVANAALVRRWGLFATTSTFEREFDWTELNAEEFYSLYNGYKNRRYEQELKESEEKKAEEKESEERENIGEDRE